MNINSLSLQQFKNLSGTYTLSPGVTLIVGDNGLGKTNFLETIYYLSRGRSLRHSDDRHLILWGASYPFTKLQGTFSDSNGEEHSLSVIVSNEQDRLQKKYFINEVPRQKTTFKHTLPVIVFAPTDIEFLIGSPDVRRTMLDDFVGMLVPGFTTLERDYSKTLKQRNKLLKQIRNSEASEKQLGYWDEKLIEFGADIIGYRIATLVELLPFVKKLAHEIFAQDLQSLDFDYLSKVVDSYENGIDEIKSAFEQKLLAGRDKELNAAMTLYGPQRDDISFFYVSDIKPKISIHEFGSRGQMRIVALIFKFAMWHHLRDVLGEKPVMLLDDVMAELDEKNRKRLEDVVKGSGAQVFITGTSKEEFSNDFITQSSLLDLDLT
ncbi:DNA replication and repair protein RecF [Candidatus Dojkabacteria bacterium]|uniref:DNA replication and repair protein RecF n=1 Tax=Candidatus Dojkabacteria bacterium TaxID=2099670 RepID=A0A955L7K1_9BACT|nr:DNA replication and repair protein RecF [Candidatus Dojkabacteria bacterium]